MTEREWKPGDLAMVTAYNRAEPYRAYYDGRDETWRACDGAPFCVDSPTSIRPLVVIDVGEDGAIDKVDVDRLDDLLWSLDYSANTSYLERYTALAAALREYVDPTPKPDEPQGWLAAVEDLRTDQRWYRDGDADTHPWRQRRDDGIHARNTWDELPRTVRVLSEGVTQ